MKVGRKSLSLAVAALLALSVSLTGCGGGSSTTTETKTIKIGVGAPLTAGATALGEGILRGAELAVAQANESETVTALGIKFEIVSGDDQGDPKTGTTVANQFVSDNSIVGIVGHLNSGVSIPASAVYNEAGIVMISPASTNPSLTDQGFTNVFRVCTTDAVQGPSAANYATNLLGVTKAFVIDDSTTYGEGLASAFAEQFATNGGTVVDSVKTSDKDTDFTALVTKIKSAGVDIVYYGGMYNSGALLVKQLRDAGVDVAVMGGDGFYDAEFINLAGADNCDNVYATSVGLPLADLPNGAAFEEAFAAAYPNEEIAAYDTYAYDACNVIIAAVIQAAQDESVGVAKLTTAAGKASIVSYVAATNTTGLTGEISFDANGDTTNKAITLYTVTDGAWAAKATSAD